MLHFESLLRSARQLFVRICAVSAMLCALSAISRAQDASSYLFQTGQPSFGAVDKFPGGTVDISNGNLHIEIPLAGSPQRGSLPLNLKLVYDSRLIWAVASSSQGSFWTTTQDSWGDSGGVSGHVGALGWRIVGNPEAIQVDNWKYSPVITCQGSTLETLIGRYRWLGPDGHIHLFNVSGSPHCVPGGAASDAYATDASGLHLFNFESGVTKIYARDGTLVYADPTPVYSGETELSCSWIPEDTNGNFQTWTIQGDVCPQESGLSNSSALIFPTLTDTLGRQPITLAISQLVTVQVPNSQNTASTTNIQMASHGELFTGFGPSSGANDCNAPPVSICQYPNWAVQSITLPDGSQYTFTYDCSSSSFNAGSPAICNSPGGSLVPVYGLMTSMTLPTGGTVNFSYTNFTDSSPSTFKTNRWLTGVSYGGGQWSYTPATGCGTNCQTVTVARPSGAHEVYMFDTSTGTAALNTSIQYFNGPATGTPSLTIQNAFQSYPANVCNVGFYSTPVCLGFSHLTTSTVTIPAPAGNLMSQTSYLYDSFPDSSGSTVTTGKLLSKSEYAFGLGTVGPLARKTTYSYLDDANPNYRTPGAITGPCPLYGHLQTGICIASAANFMDRVVDQQLQDGSSNIVAETKTTYDSTPLVNFSGIQNHDDPNFGTGNTIRGNPTQVQKLVSGSTFITTATASYDTTGQMASLQDGNGNVTSFSYADNFFTDSTPVQNPPSQFTPSQTVNGTVTTITTNAYLTKITLPIIGSATLGYYYGSGKPASSVDQNGADTYSHFLDPLDRPTHSFLPITNGNRGWSLNTYVPGGTQWDTYTAITDTSASTSCVSCTHTRQNADAFGRAILSTLVNDPDGPAMTATTYDSSGRTHTVSNPYRSTSDPTYGLTTMSFDVLGRPALATEADNSTVKTYYGTDVATAGGAAAQLCSPTTYGYGYPILHIDEASKKKQTWTDAFGRTIEVDEPDSTGTLSFATCYTYDTLDNLTKVEQKDGSTDPTQWRTRTFAYDGLSRLVTANEPESGTTTYTYDNNGNVLTKTAPAPNQTGSATTTTSYQYDALNRLTTKSGGFPTVAFTYDAASLDGHALTNSVGRLARALTSGAATWNSYDLTGNIINQWQSTPHGSFPLTFKYDLAGDRISYTDGLGTTFTQSFDVVGRPTGLSSSLVDANHPATLATVDPSLGYYPHGAVRKVTFGNSLTQTAAFNNNLQPCRININSTGTALTTCGDALPSGNLQDFSYGFNTGVSDNGNVMSWLGTGQQSFSRAMTYDSVNRLATLNQSSGSATGCSAAFNLSWTYDAWANRTDQTVNNGSCNAFHAAVNAQNQLVDPVNNAYKYDAAGNMINDGNYTYSYDAEHRLIKIGPLLGTCTYATACYVYDANGLRVETIVGSTTTDVVRDLSGNIITESTRSGGGGRLTVITAGYTYFAGQLLSQYYTGGTFFFHPDHLGSTRLITALNQSITQSIDYLPFGDINYDLAYGYPPGPFPTFAGYEPDGAGLDYALARHFNSTFGRFMQPDPLRGSPGNPQSWNRYAYVYNNPLNATDPSGLCAAPDFDSDDPDCDPDGSGTSPVPPTVWTLHYDYSADYSAFLNSGYSGPLIPGIGQYYPDDGSIMSQIMNNPTLASNWTRTFNNADHWVKAGTIWEGGLTGIAFGAPAIAAAGSAAYGAGVNVAARGLGWYYGTFGTGTGVVLGRYNVLTNYLQAARAMGANALNSSPRLYNFFSEAGEWWTLNRAFLDASVARGQQFYMSSPVLGQSGYYAMEMQYLISKGVGPDQWRMVYLPY